ncbi:helicase-related protein [Thalassovita taeanensis]|uniref:ATP-dependent RNA helicase SUPV3L1/SUV3 n=1 Tax=Thalassovita taeanensis TaxID=657014 RepID=A0A1H9KKE4_9RHOB|nr:helicase-related protein [Thalassovita taeanensis]SEQ99572.1 ATP-dependent RNA helicase SUPV3L1/SUV3 [Thalassovita taeanensis]
MAQNSRITAVLGPTNTGKTHYAIERMLGHRTGIIGLPLRLLAREVYDKIVALRGPSVVALVTGEERIVPPRTQYWVCTVEAMPEGMGCDFLAVDEIQICADPERGHVFTDRLLRSRGLHETLFLGSDTMRQTIAALVPQAQFMRRERLSQLVYSGSKKISRMQPRSAIVGFSVDNVYAIAELLRRQKGGAAVVMGALSPRTRNAQVELYQNGDVDYLVATDAIGMGLNLDINHVAFSSLAKFDGRRMRMLMPNELAQIAGRAGRGMSDGTFGVTGDAAPLEDGVAQAIMDHRFAPIRKLNWRNPMLQFGTVEALINSLETSPDDELLLKSREADDLMALKTLSQVAEIRARASDGASVKLLWDVCRIPDFRGISHAEHAGLLEVIFNYLHQRGQVPNDWMARQIKRIDRTDGDIDTLSKRLAFIRTWTYVAQRSGWVDDESHWRGATRAVEDRLSDALHERLTQRFVDRRTSVLLRRLKQKEALLADVNDKGEVTVEGEFVGRLEGFRFRQDKDATGQEAKTLRQASLAALTPHFHLRADRFYNAPDTEIDYTEQGGLMWGDQAVGKLVAGADPLKPQITAFVDDEAGHDVVQKVQRRLQHFIDRKIAALFEPLLALSRDETLNGLARGFAFRMVENMGVIPRSEIADEVKALDQEARGALRKHGIRFGQFTIFMPLLLKPAPTRLRLVLWSLSNGLQEFPEAPPPGLVTVPSGKDAPQGYHTMAGYRAAGDRAIRIDMLERLADMLRGEDSRAGFEAKADMLSITGMTLEQFADLMQGLGYAAEKGERAKAKVTPAATAASAEAVETPAEGDSSAAEGAVVAAPVEAEPVDVVPAEAQVEVAPAEVAEAKPAEAEAPELETFYTFTWGRRPQGAGKPRGRGQPRTGEQAQERPQGAKGKPRGKGGKPRRDGQGRAPQGAKAFEARPPRKEKAIDPDNPFAAALMGLKDKS